MHCSMHDGNLARCFGGCREGTYSSVCSVCRVAPKRCSRLQYRIALGLRFRLSSFVFVVHGQRGGDVKADHWIE